MQLDLFSKFYDHNDNGRLQANMTHVVVKWNIHKNADKMVILCMTFYGLLSGIVLSHDNQNDIELVRFPVVCNVHNI